MKIFTVTEQTTRLGLETSVKSFGLVGKIFFFIYSFTVCYFYQDRRPRIRGSCDFVVCILAELKFGFLGDCLPNCRFDFLLLLLFPIS